MSQPIRTAVVVGNPKPASRTLVAAQYVAERLTGREPDLVVDLATYGGELLDWKNPEVDAVVAEVGSSDLVVVACPTYKATYTGLLKLFLDRFSVGQLAGVAVPLMLGGGPTHALAPELGLHSLLTHLGATVPTGGLYVLDQQYDDPSAYDEWLARAQPVVDSLLRVVPEGATA
ncbi:NAD(P)H-dependent oxidoreductase [Nocardioides maradonensis]